VSEWPSGCQTDLRRGIQIPEGIVHAQEAQTESLPRFVEGSLELFAALSSGDQARCSGEWIAQSLSLIWMLPPETRECPGMTPAHWERRREFASYMPIIFHTILR
jgi:hypothetical protein